MMRCSACGSADARLLARAGDRLFRTTAKEFELHECAHCRVVFLSPTPSQVELDSYYPSGYWWQTGAAPGRTGLWHRLLEAYRGLLLGGHVRRIKRLARDSSGKGSRLLDLGCGDGLLLFACGGLPLLRLGVDRSLEALRAARQRGGFSVIQGSLSDLPFTAGALAVITLIHVLEHLALPDECLREAHRVLEAGGWLVVQVPNTDSLQRQLLGRRWAGFDVPRHLINYSVATLAPILRRNGFEIVRVSHFSARDNPAMVVMSLFPRLYPPARRLGRGSRNGFRSWFNPVLDLVYLFLVLLATPLAWAESLGGRGGTIVVEARKSGPGPL